MQHTIKNKAIGQNAANSKEQPREEEYHFSGGGEYEPITVLASSHEEAEKKWLGVRKKVEN